MKASAIIVAAGSGSRLGFGEPKAFVKVRGRTMLSYSLGAITRVRDLGEAVIAVPAGMESAVREECSRAGLAIPVKIAVGGAERQDSVRIALALTSAESEVVAVHDAARPFAGPALFERCIETAARTGAAIAAIPVADTLKRVMNGSIRATVSRAGLYQAQTPQAFQRKLLVAAHERAVREKVAATDDADLVEQLGGTVEVVEASAINLKITTKADLALAEAIAASVSK